VGVAAFSDRVRQINPPARSKRRFFEILDFLRVLEPDGRTRINECLTEYATIPSSPGILIIISDLLDEKGYRDGFLALTARDFDIHLIHLLDHEEIYWSERGNLRLTESETGEEKQIYIDGSLLEIYRGKVNRFISDVRSLCDNYGIRFYLYDTGIPFEDFLIDYLTRGTLLR
jgi:hypothetical protein